MGVWDFIQDQVLGMKWLNELLGIGLSALGLDVNGRIGGSVQFFIYDVLKITVLLCVLIFAISYIQSYFPPERSKRILGRFHGIWANIISALLGTVTPFCSCSSIPLFIGFTSAGLPLGVTFSFLISSPMVDLGSLVLLMSIFGAKVAVVYVILGLVIAVIGGSMIEKLRMEKYVESFVLSAGSVDIESPDLTIRERLTYAKEQMLGTFKKVFPYILIGVGIGALIHNWIPESWIETVLGSNNPFGVILATIVGIPMYADIFGTIPVAEALLSKGAQLGTVLSFMMAVTTLSLPSLIMLRKAVKPKLLALFIGICTIGIIIVGYLFNAFQFILIANCKCKLDTCTVELSESERRSGWKPLASVLGDAAAAFGCVNRVEELVKQFLRGAVAKLLARPSVQFISCSQDILSRESLNGHALRNKGSKQPVVAFVLGTFP